MIQWYDIEEHKSFGEGKDAKYAPGRGFFGNDFCLLRLLLISATGASEPKEMEARR